MERALAVRVDRRVIALGILADNQNRTGRSGRAHTRRISHFFTRATVLFCSSMFIDEFSSFHPQQSLLLSRHLLFASHLLFLPSRAQKPWTALCHRRRSLRNSAFLRSLLISRGIVRRIGSAAPDLRTSHFAAAVTINMVARCRHIRAAGRALCDHASHLGSSRYPPRSHTVVYSQTVACLFV